MIRSEIQNLLAFFVEKEAPKRSTGSEDAIEIYSATQQVDSAYERFRNLLDPGDEDVLRRKAIGRFINLRWELSSDPEKFALALLKDLARGHYIPVNTSRILGTSIAVVLKRAVCFIKHNNQNVPKWFLPMVAVEVDRIIYPREGDDALVYFFFEEVEKKTIWKDDTIDVEDKNTQLFLACHRVLAKTDEAELFWHLYRTAEPSWQEEELNDDKMNLVVKNFAHLQQEIETALYSPMSVRVLRRLHSPAVPYRILRDVLRQPNATVILANNELLATSVRDLLMRRIKKTEKQMLKRVWHAAAFLFLTKSVLAIATEIPYEIFLGGVRYFPLMINLLFPSTLLFLMAGTVVRPGNDNTERMVKLVQNIVARDNSLPEVRIPSVEGKSFRKTMFAAFYALTAVVSVVVMVWVLNLMDFSLLGGFYFIMFLALVSFLGLRLRSAMRDFRVITKKQGLSSFVVDFLTVPIIDFGRELSMRATQINIFLFIMDALIEAPFKVVLGLIEEWFSFVRERKEDLV
jgi:hypothetical protein